MAKINLSNIITKKYLAANPETTAVEKQVITYYLKNNFTSLLGHNTIDQENFDMMVQPQDGFVEVDLETIYSSLLRIKIGNINQSGFILAYTDDSNVFSILNKDKEITNEVLYTNEDGKNIVDKKSIVIDNLSTNPETENYDITELSLAREEDGEEVYEGTLVPILARAGATEYFEFKSSNDKESKKNQSFLERLVELLSSSTLVSVNTNNDNHKLVEYLPSIYSELQNKLEKTRIKKDIKTLKRALKQKND